ncbi:hypothetical protein RINTHM_4650 [Richelia intracellularis HM01]|nr:hypothetical protein RINTHM_4650 [Richelia intracellularis HM01]
MPRFARATEILQLVVDLPIPPFPYTANFTLFCLVNGCRRKYKLEIIAPN